MSTMKSGDWKMVVQTLASGQTQVAYRVFFHAIPYGTKPTKVWEPAEWADNPDNVERYLRAVHDWSQDVDEPDALGKYKLEFMKKIGPGCWEFAVNPAGAGREWSQRPRKPYRSSGHPW